MNVAKICLCREATTVTIEGILDEVTSQVSKRVIHFAVRLAWQKGLFRRFHSRCFESRLAYQYSRDWSGCLQVDVHE